MPNSNAVVNWVNSQYGSYDPTKFNIRRKQWYDEVRYPVAGTTALSFMSIALGGTDPNSGLAKTYEQTNLTRTGQFDGSQFLLYQVRTYIHLLPKQRQTSTIIALPYWFSSTATVQDALHDLSNQGVLTAIIGQKEYVRICNPFQVAPPGFGLEINTLGAANASAISQNTWFQQSPDQRDVYELNPPQLIENNQTFQWNLTFPDGTSPAIPQISSQNIAVNIMLVLDGYTIENVQ